jgi:hypothetical protein
MFLCWNETPRDVWLQSSARARKTVQWDEF